MSKYNFTFDGGEPIANLKKKQDNGEYKKVATLYYTKKGKGKLLKNRNTTRKNELLGKENLTNSEKDELLNLLKNKPKSTSPSKYNKFIENNKIELPTNFALYPMKRSYPGSEREVSYVTGISGSGKSHFVGNYIQDYKEKYPKNDIVVFSALKHDEEIDKYKPIRIDKETLIDDPIEDLDELKNTLCIFDDTNAIVNKSECLAVRKLRDMILETGRHSNTSAICTSHMATDGLFTKYPIRESHQIVVFPRGNFQTERLLKTYCGMNNKMIEELNGYGTRWFLFNKSNPSMILHKRGGRFL